MPRRFYWSAGSRLSVIDPHLFLDPRLTVAGINRPCVQFQLLKGAKQRPYLTAYAMQGIVLGWLAEPFYWAQRLLYRYPKDMPEPVFIVGCWRGGTTYLHTELVKETGAATVRNYFVACPQAALLLKPLLKWLVPNSPHRFFDWVPLPKDGPQELDCALNHLAIEQPPQKIGMGELLVDGFRALSSTKSLPLTSG